jgi:manganese transport protein
MERFLNMRLLPWARQLIIQCLAIVPAIFVILIYGSEGVGQLLILSHVVLSFELPFAIVPLVMFTASRAKMGEPVAPRWLTGLCWVIAAIILLLNVNLLSTVLLG